MGVNIYKEAIVLPRNRLVLFPHGPSSQETEDKLRKMLVHCGANIHEFKDSRYPNIERFIAAMLKYHRDGWFGIRRTDELPIVVLTKTTYPAIIKDRNAVTEAIPALRATLWIAFVDSRENPFFFKDALKNGTFNDDYADIPIWIETNKETNYRYLILTPDIDDESMDLVEARANEMNLLNATTWHQRESPSSRHSISSSTDIRTVTQPSVSSSGTYKVK